MVQTRIKPYKEQVAEQTRRSEQTRLFRRNQIIGLLILAGAIVLYRFFHTLPAWIFPPGWWHP